MAVRKPRRPSERPPSDLVDAPVIRLWLEQARADLLDVFVFEDEYPEIARVVYRILELTDPALRSNLQLYSEMILEVRDGIVGELKVDGPVSGPQVVRMNTAARFLGVEVIIWISDGNIYFRRRTDTDSDNEYSSWTL